MAKAISYYELEPLFAHVKSFYSKAHVIEYLDDVLALQSYNTIVAVISPEGNLIIRDYYSPTTSRHIKEFALQFAEDYSPSKPLKFYINPQKFSEYNERNVSDALSVH